MLKYITLPINLVQYDMKWSQKMLFAALSVLTAKGQKITTASNKFLASIVNINASQISSMLKDLSEKNWLTIDRDLGRRQIKLNTKELVKAGFLTEPRKKKDAK